MKIGNYELTLHVLPKPHTGPIYVISRIPIVGAGRQPVGMAEKDETPTRKERMDYEWCWINLTNPGDRPKIGDRCLHSYDKPVSQEVPLPAALIKVAKQILK